MKVSHKGDGIPEIWSAEELEAGDGVLLEIPMRYGCMAAQMKAVRRDPPQSTAAHTGDPPHRCPAATRSS
ncbi:hypothetical protein RHGRI_001270 [Rhododendron griersonianum]|uniref:Uncharacterized protein n=1 Tax=Rhododendron griersonianum TaxID=479676 RepID=A0AAV6HVA8_9ERIC|nr:hypothetical protein RHGRI_037482 [Rhododendron griersonianum]KAG5565316.1 hypothetical protein RHGRI_001270 [Rhododendron griersonianum]